jgi:hypothetical protein
MEARDKMRSTIYEELYARPYRYGASSSSSTTDFSALDDPFGDDDDAPVPVDPFERSGAVAPKPFTPATDFNPDASNPFGRLLDAPLR